MLRIRASSICSLVRKLVWHTRKQYGQKPIILDEYDMPENKVFHYGYYT